LSSTATTPDTPYSRLAAVVSAIRRRAADFVDWRPQVIQLPRLQCHWISLDLTGVSRRLLASSIRLQLQHLTGIASIGFVWKIEADQAEVWYWDEARIAAGAGDKAGEAMSAGLAPYPETSFRLPLADGLHLLACVDGCEAVFIDGGKLRKTRWFAQAPDSHGWVAFVRDAGRDPAAHPLPEIARPAMSKQVQPGWKLHTGFSNRLSPAFWGGALLLALLGVLLAAALSYQIKLVWTAAEARAEYRRLSKEHAELIALNRSIGDYTDFFATLANAKPQVSQLLLMRALVAAGVFGESTKISLLEWEYRNGRLRLLFAVPQEEFSLSMFLSALEGQAEFKDVRLMPDTPPQTVGVQLLVAGYPTASGGAVGGGGR